MFCHSTNSPPTTDAQYVIFSSSFHYRHFVEWFKYGFMLGLLSWREILSDKLTAKSHSALPIGPGWSLRSQHSAEITLANCCCFVTYETSKQRLHMKLCDYHSCHFTLSSPVVNLCTVRLCVQKFYVLPTQCIYVFCVDLRTNSDYFPIQH